RSAESRYSLLPMPAAADRTIRSVETGAGVAPSGDPLAALYDDGLDVVVARGALPAGLLADAGEALDRDDANPGWKRPNERMPRGDIPRLGTHPPAPPTYQAPRGASLDAYLESAATHRAGTDVFAAGFDARHAVETMLVRFAGGRPVA